MKFLLINILLTSFCFAQTILIDPGHGGYEVGAKAKINNSFIYEKNLTLKLGNQLKSIFKDSKYKVFLTRETDQFVSLEDRANMAEKIKADLVISLHFNSETSKTAYGIETFYIDNHQNGVVQKLEQLENASFSSNDSVVNKILIDLAVKLTSKESKQLAQVVHTSILKKVSNRFRMRDRHFRPGNFYVLALAKRPGLLIEAGFLSNKKELKKVMTSNYMRSFATGILLGVDDYFKNKKLAELLGPASFPEKRVGLY
jgi:N-acetylmuramoyl-L-alanine amidase